MLNRYMRAGCSAAVVAVLSVCSAAYAQSGTQGTVAITVTDASGGSVRDADLELTAVDTNSVRHAKTEAQGTFSFVNLPIGTYVLKASGQGFSTTQIDKIIVHAAQVTPLAVVLKVGSTSDTVNVSSVAGNLLDTTSNSLGSVIDLKAIEDLPLAGRDLTAFARLTPGYAGTTSTGLWNGQPLTNQSVSIDGAVGAASRGKYNGNVNASASPRVENIAEMAIQTDQIDLDQGFGRSSMSLNYVTRSGTNSFHGRIYVDARNSGLNANSYANNATTPKTRRPKLIYNDFGGSLSGPIIKDKLFFFGSFSTRRVPNNQSNSNAYLTSAAQTGNFSYTGTDGKTYTRNLFTMATAYNPALPNKVNSVIASELAAINSALASGNSVGTTDLNINSVRWNSSTPYVYYYPTVRLDYNKSEKLHMNLAWNMTQTNQSGIYAPPFPGSGFSNQISGYQARSFTGSFGLDYQISPRLINQLKLGYLYTVNKYSEDAPPLYASNPTIYWGLDSWGTYSMSGQTYALPVSNFYPVLNVSDSMSWQKGSHSIKFGFMWNREQDHYWNPPAGFDNYTLGLVDGDPAKNAFAATTDPADVSNPTRLPYASSDNLAEARQMYAVLAGRISSVYGSYSYSPSSKQYYQGISAYNLDELQTAWGLFAQDSWRIFPTLTLNYGMRWDFTGDNYDLTGAYHSLTAAGVYGPSGEGNLFNPGSFKGTSNPMFETRPHTYAPWNVSPQPQFGFAWSPRGEEGLLGKLLGSSDTVIRGGYGLRRFTMPQQYYWNNASSYGSFFYQQFYLNSNTSGQTGTFTPGSLSLGNTLPTFGLSPASYQTSEALSDFTFYNSVPAAGMDYHIKQPYTQSWNLGVERKFGHRAIEVRYVGNRTLHQWLAINPNEVNVFENGFLAEFKRAQANYAASGGNTFHGSNPTPIFDAAFAGEPTGSYGAAVDYENATYRNYISTGQVGAMASVLSGISGTTTYYCNLVGAAFAPCLNNAGYTGVGAGYPTNFFQANPYAAGTSTSLMKAIGYSNYNSLQIDFRQQSWHGWVFDANYTFGKTLGVGSTQNYTAGADNLLTVRDISKGYGPVPFDIKHVLHFTSSYDLPFGKGKAFLSSNNFASRMLGNWTVGSVMIFQSGAASQIFGGNATYNDYADGGVKLIGISAKTLQKAVSVHRIKGTALAQLLDPKYLSGGGANQAYLQPNTTPGTLGQRLYLYGPHAFYHDLSLSKSFPVHDRLQVRIQGEFLNAWNHPVFGSTPNSFGGSTPGTSIQSTSFATAGVTNTPRQIELRANIEF